MASNVCSKFPASVKRKGGELPGGIERVLGEWALSTTLLFNTASLKIHSFIAYIYLNNFIDFSAGASLFD